MKRISTSRLSAFLGILILMLASYSKEAPIVPAPAAVFPSQPAPITVPTCDSPCFVVQIPPTLNVPISVKSQEWVDGGASRYSFPISPSVAMVFPDLKYTDGYSVELMFVNTNTGSMAIYRGQEIIYGEGLLYFDDKYIYYSPLQGQSLPSNLTAKLKIRFW